VAVAEAVAFPDRTRQF